MGSKTTKVATIYAGRGIDLHIIVDHNAKANKVKLYKKWYQYDDETHYGWHRKKVNEFDSYGDALQYATHIVTGFINV